MAATVHLPVIATLRAAVVEVTMRWRKLFAAVALPSTVVTLAATGMHAFWPVLEQGQVARYGFQVMRISIVFGSVSGLASILIAVSVHRTILVDQRPLPSRFGVYWSGREFAFAWRAFVMYWAIVLAWMLVTMLFGGSSQRWEFFSLHASAIRDVLSVPAFYFVARFSLAFPAIAVGEGTGFAAAWRLSRGNGVRLAATLAVMPLLLRGLGALLEVPVAPGEAPLAWGARALVFCLLGVFEIAALSCAFAALHGKRAAV